jgi:hypothetical protein
MNVDDGELFADFLFFDEDASLTIRVAPGSYHIMGNVVGGNFDTVSGDLGYTRLDATGNYGLASSFTVGQELAENGLFAEPTDPVSTGQFEVELRTRLLPAGSGSPATAATLYDLLLYGGRVPDPPSWVLPAAERARLARATGHYRALNDNADYQDVRVGFAPLQFAAGGG